MDDEVLDWDDGEDQALAVSGPIDDADGVSLGSDSGDENENAAPFVEEGSAPSRITSPLTKEANTASRPASPNSLTSLQRKDSYSSSRTTKPMHAVLVDSPKNQHRSQRSKSKPLSSAQMMLHGLPPKPVTSAVSFLPSSQSSLTEATAMVARETAKGKSGGGSNKNTVAKPVYKDEIDSLPPNWEIRHPRSGGKQVYYYNNRTHESTWIHPSTVQSSRGPPSDSAYLSQDSPSLEDRYYRPADRRNDSPGDLNERSDRHAPPGPATSRRRSPSRDPSPFAIRRPRSISPERGRVSGRRGRPVQPTSAKESHIANRDRDTIQNVSSDRRWSPPSPQDFEGSKSRPRQRQRMQEHPNEAQSNDSRSQDEQPTYRTSAPNRWGAREDSVQDLHEPTNHNTIHRHRSPPPIRERQPNDRNSSTSTTRKRPTRFGTPPGVALGSDHEDWVPDEFRVEHSMDHTLLREKIADNGIAHDSVRPNSPVQQPEPVSEPQQLPRRKRAPLPPQSARFREVSRNNLPPSQTNLPTLTAQEQVQAPPPLAARSQPPPTLDRDLPPHQRLSKPGPPTNDDSIASSARYRHQSPPARYQERNIVSDSTGFTKPTDDSSSLTPRVDSAASADNITRQGSTVYLDRGQGEDDPASQPPKAPRAMGRDDAAPTAPRLSSARERSPRGSDRDARELGPSHNSDRGWKEDSAGQGRGRGPRGRPTPHLSGTNNVPVGGRIGADGIPNGPARASSNVSRVPLSSVNKIPVTNNRYTESSKETRSPIDVRNGETSTPHSASGTTPHERDTSDSRGRPPVRDVAKAPPMPPSHRSNSLQRHPEEASPPPISREVTTSPRWEQDSDRGGHLTHDRSLEPSNPLTEYPSRNAPANHERNRRDQGQPEPHRIYLQSLFYLLYQIMTERIDYAHLRSVIGGQYQRKTDLVVVPVLSATGSHLNDQSLQ
ncbi:hypothetical protein LENED_004563 [Lentinula edodes]|uniref:WW domain-containing protein n=1 Tax=Lentinula edodes TaxID=5353 RepID=A0A1Q3E6M0_LENED|nr:hypothetical protein LENED_004563 [Lentinula edodes]